LLSKQAVGVSIATTDSGKVENWLFYDGRMLNAAKYIGKWGVYA